MGGFGAAPRSFGRPEQKQDQQPMMVLPPLRLPDVQLPVVLVVDTESLSQAAGQIEAMVKAAVLSGFNLAMDEVASFDEAAAQKEFGVPGPAGT